MCTDSDARELYDTSAVAESNFKASFQQLCITQFTDTYKNQTRKPDPEQNIYHL